VDSKTRKRRWWAAVGVVFLFTALVALILALLLSGNISFAMALLMLIALLGLYLGFGFLVAVYRFVARLE
jgi:hypothetical protein